MTNENDASEREPTPQGGVTDGERTKAQEATRLLSAGVAHDLNNILTGFVSYPELMVMELYASGEASEILGMMARRGFFKQMTHHSTTSQYGTLSRGPRFISEDMRKLGRELLKRDIKGGAFAQEWSREQDEGGKRLEALRAAALSHPMSKAEDAVIAMIRAAQGLGPATS